MLLACCSGTKPCLLCLQRLTLCSCLRCRCLLLCTKSGLLGLLLYLINFAAVLMGFVAYQLVGGNQLPIQILVATAASVSGYVLLYYVLKKISPKTLVTKPIDLIWIFVIALIWNPVIFIPLHYVTQGYLTEPGNILGMMLFQIPTNSIVLFIVYSLWSVKLNVSEDEL